MGIFPVAVAAELPASISFTGKSVLVTGGNSGLGLAAAIQYVQRGASSVIITTRNAARGLEAKNTIESTTNTQGKGIVQVRVLDMDTFTAIKDFVDALQKEVNEIDIVLLNAGVIETKYKQSPEGWESDLQVNTLGTTLLAILLLPWMRKVRKENQEQHLTIVGSRNHRNHDVVTDKFPKKNVLKFWNDEKNYVPTAGAYQISKLLLQYASLEIAKLVETESGKPNPITNTVCPGSVRTDLSRHVTAKGMLLTAVVRLYTLRSLTPTEGARALLLATAASANENGKFVAPGLSDEEYTQNCSRNITNEVGKALQAQVWKEILEVLEEKVPEVKSIVR